METLNDIQILDPGLYKLPADLPNPKPDKRSKRDWTKQPFIKARSFRVRTWQNEPMEGMLRVEVTPLGNGVYEKVHATVFEKEGNRVAHADDLYKLIVPHLAPITQPNLKELLSESRWGNSAEDVLAYLLKKEFITVENVRAACQSIEAMTEEEQNDLQKKAGF